MYTEIWIEIKEAMSQKIILIKNDVTILLVYMTAVD